MARIIKWSVFCLLAALVAWRILILGVAEYFASAGGGQSSTDALAWYGQHPVALRTEALAAMRSNPRLAEAMLTSAVRQNPADGRGLMALALVRERLGDKAVALRATDMAVKLAPMQSGVQVDAGSFWLRHGHVDKGVKNWGRAMLVRPEISSEVFPVFLRIAENPQFRPVFAPVIASDPSWWPAFYQYATANAIGLDTLRDFYQMRTDQGGVVSADERKQLLNRLQQEGRWTESYFLWLNSLSPRQIAELGNLNNGNFEVDISNEGFDWVSLQAPGAMVETASTYGTTGSRALHIEFSGQRVQYRHLHQYLMLDPGKYRLRGRVRLDGLQSEKGVYWTVRCSLGDAAWLGNSEHFVGTDQWKHFTAEFRVPDSGCRVQSLRLELDGRSPLDFVADGSAWFDDMVIERFD